MASQKKAAVVNAISHLGNVYRDLAKAQKQASSAITEYATELEQAGGDMSLLATFPPLFSLDGEGISKKRSRKAALDEDGEEIEGKKRTRGPNKEKKAKDPNAPKRPASAYLEYQNSVREEYRQQFPDMSYSEVLKKIGQTWQSMSDAEKEPWQRITSEKTTAYLDAKEQYEKVVPENDSPEAAAAIAVATDADKADAKADRKSKEQTRKSKASPSKSIPVKEPTPAESSSTSEDESESSDESSASEENTPPPPRKSAKAAPAPAAAKGSKASKRK